MYHIMGEKDFLEAMGIFYQQHIEIGATSKQFLNHVKQHAKTDLGMFYKEWIYGAESTRLILDGVSAEILIKRYKH